MVEHHHDYYQLSVVTGSKHRQVCFQDFGGYTLAWIKNKSVSLLHSFLTIDTDLSMKFKQDILFITKFKVPWSLQPERWIQFYTQRYQFL